MAGYKEKRLPKIKSYIIIIKPCYILLQNFPERTYKSTKIIKKKVQL